MTAIHHARTGLRLALSAALAALLLLGTASSASASHIAHDPYADAVQDVSGPTVKNAADARFAPDGASAEVADRNDHLTLDMGAGEEGTGDLRVHFGSIAASTRIEVVFLDESLREIKSETRSLVVLLGASSQDFSYSFNDHGKAYRYVRLIARAEEGFLLDAVQAMAYVGSSDSIDTDGDGRADRLEQHDGTDPQSADEPPAPGTPPPPPVVPAQEPVDRPAPPPEADKDGDGMNDEWERSYGLDPEDPSDAAGDKDGDGLSNLDEYKAGGDPTSSDTDHDGMPDRWERDHGLFVDKNDANLDPDNDGKTNIQEYDEGTDPRRPPAVAGARQYGWILLVALVAAIGVYFFLKSRKQMKASGGPTSGQP